MEHTTNLVVSQGDLGDIARVLGGLSQNTSASSVLLLDKGGQLISNQGQGGQRDIVALGALLAGTFGSSRQVAAILGERDFRSIYQQGLHESIYTSQVGEHWLLVVVFDKQTHVGLVKVVARRAVEELEPILSRIHGGSPQARDQVINVQFRGSADAAIDQLFRE
jgi:predicted regulator of Ras-like GTPase activity (Roadblock/LC7/MglB family)